MEDTRLSSFIQWGAGIIGALIIGSLIWIGTTLMAVQTSVAVLRSQSDTQAPALAQVNSKVDLLQRQTTDLQIKVGIIESRQAESRSAR